MGSKLKWMRAADDLGGTRDAVDAPDVEQVLVTDGGLFAVADGVQRLPEAVEALALGGEGALVAAVGGEGDLIVLGQGKVHGVVLGGRAVVRAPPE
jgi:hypothetical protein